MSYEDSDTEPLTRSAYELIGGAYELHHRSLLDNVHDQYSGPLAHVPEPVKRPRLSLDRTISEYATAWLMKGAPPTHDDIRKRRYGGPSDNAIMKFGGLTEIRAQALASLPALAAIQ